MNKISTNLKIISLVGFIVVAGLFVYKFGNTSGQTASVIGAVNQRNSSTSSLGWTAQTGSGQRPWTKVVSNASGTNLAALDQLGRVFLSTDSGLTWNQSANAPTLGTIASDSTGMKLIGSDTNHSFFTSSNGGITWTQKSGVGAHFGVAVVSDTSGIHLVEVSLDGVMGLSNNTGNTWSVFPFSSSHPGLKFYSIASDSTGMNLVTIISLSSGTTNIWTSNDAGFTWAQQQNITSSHYFSSVTSNATGSKLALIEPNGYIYTSNDAGVTWVQQTGSGKHFWTSIASDSTGMKLIASANNNNNIGNGDYLYVSTDGGVTWTAQTGAGKHNWESVASNSNGTKLVAVSDDNNSSYIYTTTLPFAVVSTTATNITQTSATINGSITVTGGINATNYGFNYGKTTGYSSSMFSANGSFGVGPFSTQITGLNCGTTYHYQAYAKNTTGYANGSDMTFTTAACSNTSSTNTNQAN